MIFNSHPHSLLAHDLMRTRLLRFDAVAHVGRVGAPHFAVEAAPAAWSLAREASDFAKHCQQHCADALGPHLRHLEWLVAPSHSAAGADGVSAVQQYGRQQLSLLCAQLLGTIAALMLASACYAGLA